MKKDQSARLNRPLIFPLIDRIKYTYLQLLRKALAYR